MLIGYVEHVQGMLIVEGIEGTGHAPRVHRALLWIYGLYRLYRLYIVYVSVAARIVTGCI